MMRVGFVLSENEGWLGGINYFRNLLTAIYGLPERRIDPVVIVPANTSPAITDVCPQLEILRTPLADPGRPLWKMRRALQVYAGRDVAFEAYLKTHKIDFLSHSGHLGRFCPIPTLPWIPDFQELHLPELFSKEERSVRKAIAAEACNHATAILLSSETAAADLSRIAARCRAGVEILRFVAAVPATDSLASRQELEARYKFTGRYFFLPNQWWAHKNHRVVLDALALLKARGGDQLVLASGNPHDRRQPCHYAALMSRAAELGIGEMIRPIGLVPYRDIMSLLRWSVAVINPSLFEGWSTTVEESKSMGKTVILSDIPTHKEQAPSLGKYFSPERPDQLAVLLASAWEHFDETADRANMDVAAAQLPLRRKAFARRYEDIVLRLARA
ncbi:MAG: glycosyltransferase [Pseudolabrys sp.]